MVLRRYTASLHKWRFTLRFHAMNRFKLSLRDLFIAVTVLCVQFGLFATFFALSDEAQEWLVGGLFGLSFIGVAVCMAVVVSDLRRHRPLCSAILAYVAFMVLCEASMTNDPFHQAIVMTYGDDLTLSGLVVWCFSVSTGLVCAWITRSLSTADRTNDFKEK